MSTHLPITDVDELVDLVELAEGIDDDAGDLLAELGAVYVRAVTGQAPSVDVLVRLEGRVRDLAAGTAEVLRVLRLSGDDAVVADADHVRDALDVLAEIRESALEIKDDPAPDNVTARCAAIRHDVLRAGDRLNDAVGGGGR